MKYLANFRVIISMLMNLSPNGKYPQVVTRKSHLFEETLNELKWAVGTNTFGRL